MSCPGRRREKGGIPTGHVGASLKHVQASRKEIMAAKTHQTSVLVVGAGPAGLILSLQLAKHGIHSFQAERNLDTTKWPKMDITNCRSMELFNRLGISDGVREQGVTQDYPFDVLFSTGLAEGGQRVAKWDLPSPNAWREKIRGNNDGTMPREPYQRCSQAIFEAWLKPRIQAQDLIDSHFGLKFVSLVESEDGVESTLVDVQTGEKHIVKSQYVVGCDGAGSRIRTHIGSELIGGAVPMAMYLVHFKSRDLTTLQKQGQFWHIFFTSGAVLIAQDEIETWTAHLPITLDTDWEKMDPLQAIYDVLGGSVGSCPIKVDEIMVKSAWRPKICFADRYTSSLGRVFISGDAAHQNIPTGGYGMNTAVGDSFDLGWKLAAVLHGYGGKTLLDSYEIERKPVAVRNIERSGVHHQVHFAYGGWFRTLGPGAAVGDSPELQTLLDKTSKHVAAHDGENQDHGIEMDYRFPDSPVVFGRNRGTQPEWNPRTYVPSTFPGSRAPHVFLQDGKTSIMDLYGRAYTVVDFTEDGRLSDEFASKAQELRIPLTRLHLPTETHAAKVWEHQVVLIRPDDHVSWRLPEADAGAVDVESILKTVTGQGPRIEVNGDVGSAFVAEGKTFTSTTGNVDDSEIKPQAEFRK